METTLPVEGKKAMFGTLSVVFAALTVILPVLVVAFFSNEADKDTSDPTHFWGPLALLIAGGILAVLVGGISGLLGTISGSVALIRREPIRWLAIVGLVVNIPVMLCVLFLFLFVRVNSGS